MGDYIGEYYRVYHGGYWEFRPLLKQCACPRRMCPVKNDCSCERDLLGVACLFGNGG